MHIDDIQPDNFETLEDYAMALRNVNVEMLNESQLRDLCIYMVQNADEENLLEVSEILWDDVF